MEEARFDPLSHINSRDIREHLRAIGYAFTPLEAAWLVWQRHSATLDERHDAWQAIIRTMPDVPIPERLNTRAQPSLHGYLRVRIALEERLVQALTATDAAAVYLFRCFYHEDHSWDENDHRVYPSYQACLAAMAEETADGCQFELLKRWTHQPEAGINATLDDQMRILSVSSKAMTDEEQTIMDYVMDGLWFDFPTPFRSGDIVAACRSITSGTVSREEAFVLDELCTASKAAARLATNGDSSDMTASGYFQDPDTGEIFAECMSNYMDLEFVGGPLSGRQRVLTALSNHLKGQIDIALYSRAYRTILAEEDAKDMKPNFITEEGMRLAGMG